MAQVAWLGPIWVLLGAIVFISGLRAAGSTRAMRTGRFALALLYIGAGAVVNLGFLLSGADYADFGDGSYIPFVRDTWASLVVPNVVFFISLLIAFETAVGVLALRGGRSTQLGLIGAIGFHIALLSFGWGFYIWSVPMLVALALLLRAEQRSTSGFSSRRTFVATTASVATQ